MFFTLNKLSKRVDELCSKRYLPCGTIAPFVSMEGTLDPAEHYHGLPEEIKGDSFGIGDFFVGRDRYLWLDKVVKVPESRVGYEVAALFDFGKTGGGTNNGFESLLYIDGHPRQGVDNNHKEVFLNELAGKEIRMSFLLWTGLEGYDGHKMLGPGGVYYHQCRQAEFVYLHKKTDELYYYAKVITETLGFTEKQDDVYEELMGVLDSALNVIDWDGPEFYETVDNAHEKLMSGLSGMKKTTDATIHAVGHSHIDVAWLWRLKHTREKAQRTFSSMLRLMERYDEFIFIQSQPQLYRYIKEDCPEIYAQIKARVAEGKWEPDGGMWVEADCNVSSGEALVRQLLYGTRFFEREFGKKCEYLWLPDVFGYSWALP